MYGGGKFTGTNTVRTFLIHRKNQAKLLNIQGPRRKLLPEAAEH